MSSSSEYGTFQVEVYFADLFCVHGFLIPDARTEQLDAKRNSFILLAFDSIWNAFSSQETVDFVQQRLMKLENDAKKDSSTQQLVKICEKVLHFQYCVY